MNWLATAFTFALALIGLRIAETPFDFWIAGVCLGAAVIMGFANVLIARARAV